MPTTTSYGTWQIRVDDADTTVERTVTNALADGMCGDTNTAAIVAAYRDAINAALPASVELRGEEFFGPPGSRSSTSSPMAIRSMRTAGSTSTRSSGRSISGRS
jgi:hypothetical protein